jgi:hypothetical protein
MFATAAVISAGTSPAAEISVTSAAQAAVTG